MVYIDNVTFAPEDVVMSCGHVERFEVLYIEDRVCEMSEGGDYQCIDCLIESYETSREIIGLSIKCDFIFSELPLVCSALYTIDSDEGLKKIFLEKSLFKNVLAINSFYLQMPLDFFISTRLATKTQAWVIINFLIKTELYEEIDFKNLH